MKLQTTSTAAPTMFSSQVNTVSGHQKLSSTAKNPKAEEASTARRGTPSETFPRKAGPSPRRIREYAMREAP